MADGKFHSRVITEGIVGAFLIITALVTPFLRRSRARWGATNVEVGRSLPGDDLVSNPKGGWTHAITIRVPAAEVWPWLLQIGQGRGGFYSYELLENLVGCDIHNADRIIPEFQHLSVGDSVRLHPKMSGLPVAILEPRRALVLHATINMATGSTVELGDKMPAKYLNVSWMWFLEEINEKTTRLSTRWRYDYNPSFVNRLAYGPLFVEPIGSVMDRKMLLSIKQWAEAAAKRDD